MTQPQLVWPAVEHLESYVAALRRGWSPDNIRGEAAAKEELAEIAEDPGLFLNRLVDREAKGLPIKLPDGSTAKRLPGYRRWVWDGEFCGTIGFRWQPGTCELPPRVLGACSGRAQSPSCPQGLGPISIGWTGISDTDPPLSVRIPTVTTLSSTMRRNGMLLRPNSGRL